MDEENFQSTITEMNKELSGVDTPRYKLTLLQYMVLNRISRNGVHVIVLYECVLNGRVICFVMNANMLNWVHKYLSH